VEGQVALYRYSVGDRVSRGKGQSSLRSAAYLARACYEDQRTGWVHDFTDRQSPTIEASEHITRAGRHADMGSRQDVLFSALYAPADAPDWCRGAENIERFWNAAEAAESRRDAQVAERIIIAVPHEFTLQQAVWALQDHIREFTRQDRVVQVAIHSPEPGHDGRNLHAHLLVSLRGVDENGLKPAKALEQQDRFMNRSAYVERLRENWEHVANRHLERHGHEARLDHRSYLRQGLDIEPALHMGPGDAARECQGERTAAGDHNRAVAERNAARRAQREERERAALDQAIETAHEPPPSAAPPRHVSLALAREEREQSEPDQRLITDRDELRKLQRDAYADRNTGNARPLTIEDIARDVSPGFAALAEERSTLLAAARADRERRQELGRSRDASMEAEADYRRSLGWFSRKLTDWGIVADDNIATYRKGTAEAEQQLAELRAIGEARTARLHEIETAMPAVLERTRPAAGKELRERQVLGREARERLRQHYEAEHDAGRKPGLAQLQEKARSMEQDTTPLHERYEAEREVAWQARRAAEQEVYDRFNAYQQELRGFYNLHFEQEKAAVVHGHERHDAMEILSAMRRGDRIQVQMHRDRQLAAAREAHPLPDWESWLEREAGRGDSQAMREVEQRQAQEMESGIER
jgi:hypothetical protein